MSDEQFRDYDPEDAWDDGDPLDAKLDVLERIISDLRDSDDGRLEARRTDALRLVRKLEDSRPQRAESRRLKAIREELESL
jgi:hypothetical protein